MRERISRQLALWAALATLQFAPEVTAILHRHRSHGSHGVVEEVGYSEGSDAEAEEGAATAWDGNLKCSSQSANSNEDGEEYLVDNSLLKAKTKGMGYRFSKDMKNVDRTSFAIWGSTIRGLKEDEDWIKVGECFLPTTLKGQQVLTPMRVVMRRAAKAEKDAAQGKALERPLAAAPSPSEAAVATSAPPAELPAPVAGAVAQAPPPVAVAAGSTTLLAEQYAPATPIVTQAPSWQAPLISAVAAASTTALPVEQGTIAAIVTQALPQGEVISYPVVDAAPSRAAAAATILPPTLPVQLPVVAASPLPTEPPAASATAERKCSGHGTGRRYLLDNSKLQAQTKGMGLRFSKNAKDIDKRAKALWGSTIVGTDTGDGWLQIGECYLPIELKGIAVLTPIVTAAESEMEASRSAPIETPQTVAVAVVEPSQVASAQAPQPAVAVAPQSAPPGESFQSATVAAVGPAEPSQASYSDTTAASAQALQSTSAEPVQRLPAEDVAPSAVAEAAQTPAPAPAAAAAPPADQGPIVTGEQAAAPGQAPEQPAAAAPGKCSLSEDGGWQVSAFLLDNSLLHATTKGMGLRLSKNLKDIDKTTKAVWGSTVLGVDLGDGWLQIGNCYLPMTLQGVPVVVPAPSPTAGPAEAAGSAADAAPAGVAEASRGDSQQLAAQEPTMQAPTAEIPQAALEQAVQQQGVAASPLPAVMQRSVDQPEAAQLTLEAAPERRAPPVLASDPPDEPQRLEPMRPPVASTDDLQRPLEPEGEREIKLLKERAASSEKQTSKRLAQLEEELQEAKENATSAEQTAVKSVAALRDELSRWKDSASVQEQTATQRIAVLQNELWQANQAVKAAGAAKATADAKGWALETEVQQLRDQERRQTQELQRFRTDADEQLRELRTEAEAASGAAARRVEEFEARLAQQRRDMDNLTAQSAEQLRQREARITNLTRQLDDAKAFAARDAAHYEQWAAEVNATAARREAEMLRQFSQAQDQAHEASQDAVRRASLSGARAEDLQRQLAAARTDANEALERLTREAAVASANSQQRVHELEGQLAKEQEAARVAAAESARLAAANEAAGSVLERRLADLRQKAVQVGSVVAKHVGALEEELQKELTSLEADGLVSAVRQVDVAADAGKAAEASAESDGSQEQPPKRQDGEDPGTGAFGELKRLRTRAARSQDLARDLASLGGRALEAAKTLAARTLELEKELPPRKAGRSSKDSRARDLVAQLGDATTEVVSADEALFKRASDMEEELSRQQFALQSANDAVERQLEAAVDTPSTNIASDASTGATPSDAESVSKGEALANASASALGELEQLPERLQALTRQAKFRSSAFTAKIEALKQQLQEEKEALHRTAADAKVATEKAAIVAESFEATLEAARRNASDSFQRSEDSERRAKQLGEQLQELREEARLDAERLQVEAERTSEADERISVLTEQLGKQRVDNLQADADLQASQAHSAELERQLAAARSEAAAASDKAAKRIAELEEKLGDQLS